MLYFVIFTESPTNMHTAKTGTKPFQSPPKKSAKQMRNERRTVSDERAKQSENERISAVILNSTEVDFNRLYAIDANSHHACASPERRLMRIRVSCTALTFGRNYSIEERSTNLLRSTTSSTVIPVTTPNVKLLDLIVLSASIRQQSK